MKKILTYIFNYYKELDKRIFAFCCFLVALLIWSNYGLEIDNLIDNKNSFIISFLSRYLIFLLAFSLPYYFTSELLRKNYFKNKKLLFLLLFAPAIFSLKMALVTNLNFVSDFGWNVYWNQILYWPIRLFIILALLYFVWKIHDSYDFFWGFTTVNFHWKPYVILLLLMVPLIAFASTQVDFLAVYPKLQMASTTLASSDYPWFFNLLYEISYGSDFISIEIFFRGFLILAFVKYAGKETILPMACFYCTIHFGKPLAECISSFFGGILLGIIVLNTRSVLGGLFIHLGIAWLMEIGGYLGNKFL